jgi:DNA-binding XRE family transcriptional regulator
MLGLSFSEWILVFATISGPVAAVFVTIWRDRKHKDFDRKYAILKSLVTSRRQPLSYEYVYSLNLVQIEFIDNTNVLDNFRALVEKYANIPTKDESFKAWEDDTEKRKIDLIRSICRSLKIKIDGSDIFFNSYIPVAWQNSEDQQERLKVALLDLLNGRAVLPVTIVQHDDGQQSS